MLQQRHGLPPGQQPAVVVAQEGRHAGFAPLPFVSARTSLRNVACSRETPQVPIAAAFPHDHGLPFLQPDPSLQPRTLHSQALHLVTRLPAPRKVKHAVPVQQGGYGHRYYVGIRKPIAGGNKRGTYQGCPAQGLLLVKNKEHKLTT